MGHEALCWSLHQVSAMFMCKEAFLTNTVTLTYVPDVQLHHATVTKTNQRSTVTRVSDVLIKGSVRRMWRNRVLCT